MVICRFCSRGPLNVTHGATQIIFLTCFGVFPLPSLKRIMQEIKQKQGGYANTMSFYSWLYGISWDLNMSEFPLMLHTKQQKCISLLPAGINTGRESVCLHVAAGLGLMCAEIRAPVFLTSGQTLI